VLLFELQSSSVFQFVFQFGLKGKKVSWDLEHICELKRYLLTDLVGEHVVKKRKQDIEVSFTGDHSVSL
jgi:hypothetical protein